MLLLVPFLLCLSLWVSVEGVTQPTLRKVASASPITISKIETSDDAYAAAKLSIDVFFKENLPPVNDGSIFSQSTDISLSSAMLLLGISVVCSPPAKESMGFMNVTGLLSISIVEAPSAG